MPSRPPWVVELNTTHHARAANVRAGGTRRPSAIGNTGCMKVFFAFPGGANTAEESRR